MSLKSKSNSTSSVLSFSSDQLEEENLTADVDDLVFDVAPWDITGEHEAIGKLVVAKKGEKLPLTTKYKRKDSKSVPVKFLVTDKLEVTPIVYESKTLLETIATHSALPKPVLQNEESIETSELPATEGSAAVEAAKESSVEGSEKVHLSPIVGKKPMFLSDSEFVSQLEQHFEEKVIGGMEAGLRTSVVEKVRSDKILLPKENNALINSIIQAVYEQFGGHDRPSFKLCEKLANLLKFKFPSTFQVKTTVQSPLGTLSMSKSKGEGGFGDLSKRIGDNFYNRIIRKGQTLKRPNTDTSPVGVLKKKKKMQGYCLSAERWNIDESVSRGELEEAKKSYVKLDEATSKEEKKQLMVVSRAFIQKQFKLLEPGQAVEDLKSFWEGGAEALSEWFEWLVGGSKLGNLSLSVAGQLKKIMNIVEEFIISKRGDDFLTEMEEKKAKVVTETGNSIMYELYLLRNLSKLFKNKPEKWLFFDGTDDKKNGPEEKDPNIFVTKMQNLGVGDFEKKVMINIRIGDKVVFQDISLPEAVAGLVQIYFCFNLLYPPEVDDSMQFLERIVCNFGSTDGARNKRNSVKKGYRDFEVKIKKYHRIFGKPCSFQGFTAKLLLESDQGEMLAVFTK